MDPALAQVVRNAAWWLVVGGSLGFVGAVWPPYRQWSAPLEEGLRVISAHPIGWKMIHLGFVTGIWTLVAGLSLLAWSLSGRPGVTPATVSAVLLALAALAWTADIVLRLGPTVWAADSLVATGAVPEAFGAWRGVRGVLFAVFSVLAYLAVAGTGWAMLDAGLVSRTLGWVLVAWGLSLGFGFGYNVPVVAYIPFMVLGGFLLRG